MSAGDLVAAYEAGVRDCHGTNRACCVRAGLAAVDEQRGAAVDARPWAELRTTGLLWLINRTVFHPRGYALAIVVRDGLAVGWQLLGDGSEVWRFDGGEDEHLQAVNAIFAEAAYTPESEGWGAMLRHGAGEPEVCTCQRVDIGSYGHPHQLVPGDADPDCPIHGARRNPSDDRTGHTE